MSSNWDRHMEPICEPMTLLMRKMRKREGKRERKNKRIKNQTDIIILNFAALGCYKLSV